MLQHSLLGQICIGAVTVFEWCTRRCGGLATIATLIFSCWVISSQPAAQDPRSPPAADTWTTFFAYYCLAAHVLIAVFYIRLNYATIDITRRLKAKQGQENGTKQPTPVETLERQIGDIGSDRLVHVIVIPNYMENIEVLRETLDVLASHARAEDQYDVCLAMEQREKTAEAKAKTLIEEFSSVFRSISYTIHPYDIPGESAGKGSNLAWAVQQVSTRYPTTTRQDIIVTGIDADSHLSSRYFELLTELHVSNPDTAPTTIYSAPIIFDRNCYEVPALTRVADILWGATGISGLYSGSTIAPPTSVYSLPLILVDRVGGWDCDCEAIGEDLHMFIKCFFALNGNLNVQTILSPVSQTNINGNGSFLDGICARYGQGLRHMWGALDCGYYVRKCIHLFRERKRTQRAFHPLHIQKQYPADMNEPLVHLLDRGIESGISQVPTVGALESPNWMRVLVLGHRMLELHFMPVQVIIAISLNVFLATSKETIPYSLIWVFRICSILGAISGLQLPFYLLIYTQYHKVAVSHREDEMNQAGLSKGMRFAHRDWKRVSECVLGPVVVLLSGVLPAFHAQISHFWTLNLTYKVSKKAMRQTTGSES